VVSFTTLVIVGYELGGPQSQSGQYGKVTILDPTWTDHFVIQPIGSCYTDYTTIIMLITSIIHVACAEGKLLSKAGNNIHSLWLGAGPIIKC
jgi:hypothetical protein